MFDRLVAFKQRNGHCLVPKRYAEDPKLGTWVETQRVQYKRLQREYDETRGVESVQPNKRLNQERLRKLHEIGFAWSAKHVRKQRNNSLQQNGPPPIDDQQAVPLPETGATMHGTMLPIMNMLIDNNPAPIATAARPRKSEPRQAGRLNDQQWEEMYQRLVRYKEQFGDCLVPRKFEQDPKLSTWVETQRFLWNRDHRNASGGSVTTEGEQDRQYASPTMQSSIDNIPALPDPTHVPHAASLSDWSHGGDIGDGDDAAVVAAAAAAAAEAVDEEVGSTGGGIMNMAAMKDSPTQPKRLTKERKEKLDAIGFVWSLRNKRIDDHWDEMFRQLIEYKEKHGDCLVPSRYETNLKLGKWVETQRYEYTKLKRAEANPNEKPEEMNQEETKLGGKPRVTNARLTEERLRRLESIGFEWKVRNKMKRYYDKQWQDMFDQLMDFKAKNGHTMVPKRFPDNPRLANWVHTQRIQYRKLMAGARKDNSDKDVMPPPEDVSGSGDITLSKEDEISFRLTDERRRKLEEIGFVWSVRESDAKTDQNRMTRNSYDDLWDAMFERLKAFKTKYGNCLVPKRSKEDPKLGTWVDTQRVQYKKMKKKLADQGVPFDEQKPSPEEMLEAKAQNKPVVGRLTEDRIRRLNELGFVWSLRDDWMKHYEELKQFKQEHGHCNVPARYSKNRRLGIWVSAQRQQYKQMQSGPQEESGSRTTPLTEDRIALLNELGFTWTIRSRDSLGESWNQRLQELRDYMAVHGNCLVPSRYPPNPELGIWVGTQVSCRQLHALETPPSASKVFWTLSAHNIGFISRRRNPARKFLGLQV
uniref:Helicase-associated domain-containing protein n=1 Tax=Amphora coffeiformis TaxID=265554 RepID=A0A7S3P091_9STRA